MPAPFARRPVVAFSLVLVVGCSGASASSGLFGASSDGGVVDDGGVGASLGSSDDATAAEPDDEDDGGAARPPSSDGAADDDASDRSPDAGPRPTAGCLALYPETLRASATIVEVPYGAGEVKYVATDSTTSPAGQGGVDVRLALCRPGINPALVLVTITPDTTAPFTWVFGPVAPIPGVTQAALVYGPAFDKVWATATFTR